jgi:hypothetical protein
MLASDKNKLAAISNLESRIKKKLSSGIEPRTSDLENSAWYLEKRVNRITGPNSFRDAKKELVAIRNLYSRTKKNMSSAEVKRVKQKIKNVENRLSSLGNLNKIPSAPRSTMNRIRRKPAQKNYQTYGFQISSYMRFISSALRDANRQFGAFQTRANMHNGLSAAELQDLRWEGNLARNAAPSIRVLISTSKQNPNPENKYVKVQNMLDDIKQYIEKLRSVDPQAAARLDFEWRSMCDESKLGQRLVSKWRALPQRKKNRLRTVYKAFRNKLNANIKLHSIGRNHGEKVRSRYQYNEPRMTPIRRPTATEWAWLSPMKSNGSVWPRM